MKKMCSSLALACVTFLLTGSSAQAAFIEPADFWVGALDPSDEGFTVTGTPGADGNWVLENVINEALFLGQGSFPGISWMVNDVDSGSVHAKIDLGGTHTIDEVRFQAATLFFPNWFSNPNEIRLDFSDGSTQTIFGASAPGVDGRPQALSINPVTTTFVDMTIISHYNDGSNGNEDNGGFSEVTFVEVVPEPATLALLAIGSVAALFRRRRK